MPAAAPAPVVLTAAGFAPDSYHMQLDAEGRVLQTSPRLAALVPGLAANDTVLTDILAAPAPECSGPVAQWPSQISLTLKGGNGGIHFFEAAVLRTADGATLLLLDVSTNRRRLESEERRRQVLAFSVSQAAYLRQAPPEQMRSFAEDWLEGLRLRMHLPSLGLFTPAEQGWTLYAHAGQPAEALLWIGSEMKGVLGTDDGGGPRQWRSMIGESAWLVPYREHDGLRAWLVVGDENAPERVPYFSRLDWNIMLMLFAAALSSGLRYLSLQRRLQRSSVIEGLLSSGWWEFDPDTQRTCMAPGLASSLGLELDAADSIDLESSLSILDPLDRDMLRGRLEEVIRNGASFSEAVQLRMPGGDRWLRLKGERVMAPTMRIVGYVLDISDLRRQQEETASARARLEGLLDAAPAVIFVQRYSEGSLQFEFCSASLNHVLGWSLQDLQREPFYSFVHPEDRNTYYERTRTLLQTGYSRRSYRVRDRSGAYHWMLDEAKLLRDTRGMPMEVVGLMMDVSEATEAVERVKESEERYRVLVEDAPAVICRYLPDLTLTFANQTMIKRLELDEARISRYDLTRFMTPEDLAATRRRLTRFTPTNPVHTMEFSPKAPDGRRAKWIWSERGIFDKDGRLVEVQAVGRDETQLLEAREQLYQSAKMATLGEMATGLAHEISQPLTVMRMALANIFKRLRKDELEPEYLLGKLERVESQVARASKIVEHVRIFGRRSEESGEPFDPCQSIDNLVLLVEEGMGNYSVELKVDAQPVPQVEGHQDRLEQVLLNLVLNAKYAVCHRTQERDEPPCVWVSCHTQDGEVVISVEDNGDGIDPLVIDRIFEPFVTTKPVGSGTGLGLSLSYSIITQARGKLTAVNTGKGACFRVSLPIHSAVQEAVAEEGREALDPAIERDIPDNLHKLQGNEDA